MKQCYIVNSIKTTKTNKDEDLYERFNNMKTNFIWKNFSTENNKEKEKKMSKRLVSNINE